MDRALALLGLTLLAPLVLCVALAVRLSDGGPAIFVQIRIGKDGIPFKLLKFRTMVVGAPRLGPAVTIGGDSRITRVGRWLRRYKLDELPQLLNVLRGDMALVGPRPEVPEYVALYTLAQREVLRLLPGITDPASVAFRYESEKLAASADPARCYVEEVMPAKLRMNLDYAARRSLLSDWVVVAQTIRSLFRLPPPGSSGVEAVEGRHPRASLDETR